MNEVEDISYLNLLARKLDDRQLTVCRARGNTIVAAGAGSGKTQVLATRFAYLVMTENISADRILTLTFTDKAAAEMYERIYHTLTFFSHDDRVPQKARQRAETAVADFSNTHIQTLDSYCAVIVRQCANRYGIRPDFTIGTEDAENTIRSLALSFVLTHRFDESLQKIAEAGKLQDVANRLFADTVIRYTSLASATDSFTSKITVQCEEIASAWNTVIDTVSSQIETVKEYYNTAPAQKKSAGYCLLLQKALTAYSMIEISHVSADDIQNGTVFQNVQAVQSALKCFLFDQRTSGYTKDLRDAMRPLCKETIPSLLPLADYILNSENTRHIYSLLDIFLAEVNESKRQTGSLTFFDVTELALRILREQDDIRIQEKESYSRIMIDEFQDNNGKNRDLLSLISDGNLFFVGDEKQSIYKFRGADVSVFTRLKEEIKNSGGNVYSMIYNYRSSPELLMSFNLLFGGCNGQTGENGTAAEQKLSVPDSARVFPEHPAHSYEAGFTAETAARKFNTKMQKAEDPVPLTAETVPLHVCMLNTAGVLSDRQQYIYPHRSEQIAYFIVQKIQQLHNSGVPYGNIAVLDRSRTARGILMRMFSRAELPYDVDQHKDLFAEAPVSDIYYFLRLCVYPSDTRAFASYLCSPFSGLDEQCVETVLAVLIDTTDQSFIFTPFPAEKEAMIAEMLSPESFARYRAAAERYKKFAQYIPCHCIADTVTRMWYECGYRYELLWNKSLSVFLEQYDLLFELARKSDENGKNASWFVDQLAQKRETSFFISDDSTLNTDEVQYPVEQKDAVHIMTIHKSKGLEFDYVFVCGCTDRMRSDVNGDRVYYSEETGVSLNFKDGAGNYFYEKQKQEAALKNDAEFRRLVYVAVTRGRKAVFITGTWERPDTISALPSLMENIFEQYYPEQKTTTDESGKTYYNSGAPFDFTALRPVMRKEMYQPFRSGQIPVSESNKLLCAQSFAPLYTAAHVLVTETIRPQRIAPSSLEQLADHTSSVLPVDTASCIDSYSKLDCIITKKGTAFTASAFGTLVHAYLESFAGGTVPGSFIPAHRLTAALSSETDRAAVVKACVDMVQSFAESEIGVSFTESRNKGFWYRSEYAFRQYLNGFFITGAIDLLFQNINGDYTIVDYKTDHEIIPERYYIQQALYRKAAAELLRIPENAINGVLFYLRAGTTVNCTAALSSIGGDVITEKITKMMHSDDGLN